MSSRPKLRFQCPSVLTPDTIVSGHTAREWDEFFTGNFLTNLYKAHGKQMQKTVIIYETFTDPLVFILADGDLSHLNRVFVNNITCARELQDELCDMLYDTVTGEGTPLLNSATQVFPVEEVKNGAKVITAGFLP